MLEALASNSSIERFLSHFPKNQWRRCVEQVVLVGVRTIQEQFKSPPSISELRDFAAAKPKEHRHNSRKRETPEKEGSTHRLERAKRASLKATPPRHVEETPKFKEFASEIRPKHPPQTPLGSSRQLSDRKIPKYLQSVKSVIKEEVHKDISQYRSKESVEVAEAKDERYDLPRQLPSEELKSRRRPAELKEPVTVDLDVARQIFNRQSPRKESQLLKIAEDFLKDPFMTQLAKRDSMFSVPTSPKYLEGWMKSPESNLLSSLELKRTLSPSSRGKT